MRRLLTLLALTLSLILPAAAQASTQTGQERVEYASALSHALKRADGVIADTTTLIAMRADGTGWIRMRMCTPQACNEIYDTLTSEEFWRGADEETVEFFLRGDIEGLGWVDVAIGIIATHGGNHVSISRRDDRNLTLAYGSAELDGWVTEATDHSSSVWGDWRTHGSSFSFSAYRASLTWVWK